jgi:hypothetical protein
MKSFTCLIILVCFSVQPVFATCDTDLTTSTDHLTVYSSDEVYDSKTGLIWKKCLQGFSGPNCDIPGAETTFTWSDALDEADAPWRLPNVKELQSIVELACSAPAITSDTNIFPGTHTTAVWSNSPVLSGPLYDAGVLSGTPFSLAVTFNGNGDVVPSFRSTPYHVRLVRDAPAEPED